MEGTPGEGSNVVASLRASRLTVDVIEADALTSDLSVLQRYASIVLVDVPADVLGDSTMEAIRSFVGDLGHGLVVIGGTDSYGLGNYGSTPLETAMPVSMDLPKRKDLPTAAVVLIIEDLESQTSVNISKKAGEGVVGLLNPQDQVAVSDAQPGLVWPMSHVTNKAAIVQAIEAMQPEDPPSYAPFLEQAYEILKSAQAQTKHIILLGDGDAASGDTTSILQQIYRAGIRVSTIETNAAAPSDFQNLEDIARYGGGKYYPADNVNTIPQIFLKVARTVAHSGIMQGKFFPEAVAPSPIIDGLVGVPALTGYVITTPKPLATVVLASTKSDPVLAQWQYGLGRSVAWTSDAAGVWTSAWLTSPQTRKLWASMVNWTLPPQQTVSLALSSSVSDSTMNVDVVSVDGQPYRSLTAHIVGPQGTQTIALQPSAPNEYDGQAPAAAAGVYLLDVQARPVSSRSTSLTRTVSGGLVVPYAPDYRDAGVDQTLLRAIAAAGGGTVLTRPGEAFAPNLRPVDVASPLQEALLILALALIPVDVGARRLVLQRADWLALLRALGLRRATASTGQAPSPLAGVRVRHNARARRPRDRAIEPIAHVAFPAASVPPASDRGALPALTQAQPGRSAATAAGATAPRGEGALAPPEHGAGLEDQPPPSSSRLLDAKRRARRQ